MYNHVPTDYKCPICIAIAGDENEDTWIVKEDIFYKDDLVIGFISSKAIKGNEGHAIISPLDHHENIYDLPEEVGHRIFDVSKKIAIALKEIRKCDGISVGQYNEPAGGQHAFHYHFHLFPRFEGDNFNEELWKAERSAPESRKEYAGALKGYFQR